MSLVSNLIKIFKFFKPLKWAIIFQFILIILFSATALIWPYYFGKIVDGLTQGLGFEGIKDYLIIFILATLGSSIISVIKDVNQTRNIQKQSDNLLSQVSLRKMTDVSVGQHIRTDSGFKQSVLDQGEDAVGQIFFTINYSILPELFRGVFIIGAMIFISPLIGIVFLAISTFQFICYQIISFRNIAYWRKYRDHTVEVYRWNSEMIRIVNSIIFRGASNKTIAEQDKKLDDLREDFIKTWVPYEIKTGLVGMIAEINFIVMLILAITSVVSWNTLTVGAVVTLLSYGFRMGGVVDSLYHNIRRMNFKWVQVEKFFEILEIENDVKEVKNPKVLEAKENGYSIKFEDVSFSHSNEDEKTDLKALDNVSFEINAGEVCAIVGRSGAGKTTIINLLLRAFDPDKGKIKIEDVELKKLSLEAHRKNIGIVEQEVILQNTSLRENILFGLSEEEKSTWTDERLVELAKITRIDQFFDRLGEKPFDAVVGERGIKLSGGQRQRVGIARALSVNPEILIFDEATSSLDGENEKAIHDAMKDAFKNRTVIVIAHRLSTVRHADKIICMEKGKIAGIGNHEELYATCPEYKSLVDIQSE